MLRENMVLRGRKSVNVRIALGIAALILAFPVPAYAYFDASTVSMVLQAAIAGLAGGLIVLKLYWKSFIGFFRKSKDSAKTPADQEETKS